MKCSKCGHEREARDNLYTLATECPSCGVLYSKSNSAASGFQSPDSSSALNKPSPLDSSSLKKARERVEKRLRKQLENKMKDKRHEETLERARRITTINMQKRLSPKPQSDGCSSSAELDSVPPDDPIPALEQQASEGAEACTSQVCHATPIEENAAAPHSVDFEDEDQSCGKTAAPDAMADQHTTSEPAPEHQMPHPTFRVRAGSRSRISLTHVLSFAAWLILCAGLVGAVLSYTTINVQADMLQSPGYKPHALPLALLLGFAYLATGVLGFAFFWVAALINGQLKEIRRLLLLTPQPERASSAE